MEIDVLVYLLLEYSPMRYRPVTIGVQMNHDLVLTIKEIAEILKLAEKTVYSMAQDGELPAFKVRGQWRIRRVDFDGWMVAQAKSAARSQK